LNSATWFVNFPVLTSPPRRYRKGVAAAGTPQVELERVPGR